ncbi:hypothetical protein MCELHM10_03996 [Paracoccaceae bacterium]|jgi:hypothetical protein
MKPWQAGDQFAGLPAKPWHGGGGCRWPQSRARASKAITGEIAVGHTIIGFYRNAR